MTETSAAADEGSTFIAWRIVQVVVWVVGCAILIALASGADVGIHAFWNVLIPVAPALFVLAPGVWRNICPLASTALFARHQGWSRRQRVSPDGQATLGFLGVVLLFAIVPLRHVVLDLDGSATALVIVGLGVLSVVLGLRFEWKSGWCSGLCPVHPVEKLYGTTPAVSVPNMHCGTCHRCVSPCPDSTPGMHPLSANRFWARRASGTLMVGGFAGFIWGWFQVPDFSGVAGWQHLGEAYLWSFGGLAVSLIAYLVLARVVPASSRRLLVSVFAAAAVSAYYWYRLPALFGFGPFPGDGMLIDLSDALPGWFPVTSRVASTTFFFWWMLFRPSDRRSWTTRPAYAEASGAA